MVRLLCSLFILALAACSSVEVHRDWDENLDFTQFNTYYLLPDQAEHISPLVRPRIENAIVNALVDSGLTRVENPDDADLAIGFNVATENRTSYSTVHGGWGSSGFHHGRSGWGVSASTSRTTQHVYSVGTLVIAAFNMQDKQLVWEGWASKRLNSNSGQDERLINGLVGGILRDFPPE